VPTQCANAFRVILPITQLTGPRNQSRSVFCDVETDYILKSKDKESRNRPGVAQRVPGGLGSQIFMTFGT